MSFATLTAFGNLTRAPEVRTTTTGKTVAAFAVAINHKTTNGEDKTTFLDCKAFDKTAENIGKFFSKGDRIIITGELEQERWEDKNTGEKRSRIAVLVGRFDFPESKAARETAGDDHGKSEARQHFRRESPPVSDREKRETRSAAKQQPLPGGEPASGYGNDDTEIPF